MSTRKLYELIESNADFRMAVVYIPGVRGMFLRPDLLRRAVERLSGPPAMEAGR